MPSVLTGPAFCSIFSRGVSSGGGSSFFLLDKSFAVAVGVPWVVSASVSRHGEGMPRVEGPCDQGARRDDMVGGFAPASGQREGAGVGRVERVAAWRARERGFLRSRWS